MKINPARFIRNLITSTAFLAVVFALGLWAGSKPWGKYFAAALLLLLGGSIIAIMKEDSDEPSAPEDSASPAAEPGAKVEEDRSSELLRLHLEQARSYGEHWHRAAVFAATIAGLLLTALLWQLRVPLTGAAERPVETPQGKH